nr:MAG TPA: hypothetical protein [Caudoviricetes sp.]
MLVFCILVFYTNVQKTCFLKSVLIFLSYLYLSYFFTITRNIYYELY